MFFSRFLSIVALSVLFLIQPLPGFAQSAESPGYRKYREHVEQSFQKAVEMAERVRQQRRQAHGDRPNVSRRHAKRMRVPRFSEMVAHPHRRNHILLRFNSEKTDTNTLTSLGYRDIKVLKPVAGLYQVRVPAAIALEDALEQLNANPLIAYAEPDYELKPASLPNDPYFEGPGAWWLQQIRAQRAWDIATDARGIGPIAVFDGGIDVSHEDLVDNLWINEAEIASNGLDDDANGYVDDVHGLGLVPLNWTSHATAVAGSLCAMGNNNMGVTGIAWRCELMNMATDYGAQTVSATVEGLAYAISMGSRISNHSNVIWAYSQSLADAVDSAQAAGHLIVAAAGNSDQNIDVNSVYPASLPNDNIIAVTASNASEERAEYMNYGPVSVDIAAPADFMTTSFDNAYLQSFGTSQATAVVTGAVALAWSQIPEMTYADIRSHVLDHVRVSTNWTNLVSTGGILDLQAVMEALNPDTDGDGLNNDADNDDDNDGISDINDVFPLDVSEFADADGDGIGDNADNDDDNDYVLDVHDWAPLDGSEQYDSDGDGVGNHLDSDDDGDGIADALDFDSDNDGIADAIEGALTLDERIQAILSDSSDDYATASVGDWVSVTRSEYQSLAAAMAGTHRFGTPENQMNTDPASLFQWSIGDMWTFGHSLNPSPANVHVYGFMRPTGEAMTGQNDIVRLSNSSVGMRYFKVGSPLPNGEIDGGAEYFVQKGADRVAYEYPQYLGLSTDQNALIDYTSSAMYFAPDSVASLSSGSGGGSMQGLAMEIDRHRAETDFDGDGLPNRFDIDSDNDGIADIVEAGGTDANGDGLVDEPGSQGSITAPVDSDGDGLPDFSDFESTNPANDGTAWDIADTAYAVFDSNADGKVSSTDTSGGIDADTDGVDDLIDPDPTTFGLGTAGDPSGAPAISPGDVSVDESGGSARVEIKLSHATDRTVSVTAFTRRVAGSAQGGQDYYGQTVALSFAPGQTSQFMTVAIIDDAISESTEQFEIRLQGALGASIVDDVATVTILDDDSGAAGPSLSVADQTFHESDGMAAVEVRLDAPATSNVTVTVFTRAAGSAAAGSDFYGTSQSLSFTPGETRKLLDVTILDDGDAEDTETFEVRLVNASGADIDRGRATISLTDNDTITVLPALSLSSQDFSEGIGTAEVVVTLTPASSQPVSVMAFTRMDGTVTGGQDLYGASSELIFAPGETRKILQITVLDDSDVEPAEAFRVNLAHPVGATIETSRATMWIIDDDILALPELSISSVTVNEGVGTATLTVTLSFSANEEIRINTNYQSAHGGEDYVGFTRTMQFVKDGPTTQSVEVTIVDDAVSERTEYFFVRALFARDQTYQVWKGKITIEDDD